MAKAVFNSGYLLLASTYYYVTNIKLSEQLVMSDSTTLNDNVDDENLVMTGNRKSFTCEMWKHVDAASPLTGLPYTGTISFEGYAYNGQILITGWMVDATLDSIIKIAVSGIFMTKTSEVPV